MRATSGHILTGLDLLRNGNRPPHLATAARSFAPRDECAGHIRCGRRAQWRQTWCGGHDGRRERGGIDLLAVPFDHLIESGWGPSGVVGVVAITSRLIGSRRCGASPDWERSSAWRAASLVCYQRRYGTTSPNARRTARVTACRIRSGTRGPSGPPATKRLESVLTSSQKSILS